MTTSRLMLLFAAMFLALLALIPVPGLAADAEKTITLTYGFTAQGREFGTLELTRTPAEHAGTAVIREQASATMNLEDSQQFRVRETALFSRDGQLWEYSATIQEKDTYEIRATRNGGRFELELKQNGSTEHEDDFDAGDVDFSSQYFPMDRLMQAEKQKFRMLSLGELDLIRAVVEKVGSDAISVSGTTFDCTAITLDAGSESSKKWMARDANGYWFTVREEVRAGDGDYEMVLTNYRVSE